MENKGQIKHDKNFIERLSVNNMLKAIKEERDAFKKNALKSINNN